MIALALLFFALFLFSLGQLGRVELYDAKINGYLYELPLCIFVVWSLYQYRLRAVTASWRHFKWTALFLGYMIISFLWNYPPFSTFQNAVAGLYIVRFVFYLLLIVNISYYVFGAKGSRVRLTMALMGTISLILLSSAVQFLWYPDLRNLSYLGWDEHLNRVFGVFLDTGVAAALLGLFSIWLIRLRVNPKRPRTLWINLALLGTSVLAIFTYSRGLYLGAAAAALYLGLRVGKIWLVAAMLILAVTGLVLLSNPATESTNLWRTSSIVARVQDSKEALDLWKKHPILGVGYNRTQFYKKPSAPRSIKAGVPNHGQSAYSSTFLTILVALGLVGLAGFLLVLWEISRFFGGGEVYILFLSVFSLFDNILLHPFILCLLAYICALEKNKLSTPSRSVR